jgi:hypothetical protein
LPVDSKATQKSSSSPVRYKRGICHLALGDTILNATPTAERVRSAD